MFLLAESTNRISPCPEAGKNIATIGAGAQIISQSCLLIGMAHDAFDMGSNRMFHKHCQP